MRSKILVMNNLTTQTLRDALALATVMFGANDPATRSIAAELQKAQS